MPTIAEQMKAAQEGFEKNRRGTPAAPGGPAEQMQTAQDTGLTADERAKLEKAGVKGALDAGALGLADSVSFGLLPWMIDKFSDLTGDKDPRLRDVKDLAAKMYPKSTIAGNIGGSLVPGLGAAKAAGNLLKVGKMGAGMIGSGAANVADQVVRGQTEGKQFSPFEAAASTALGGGLPALMALKSGGASMVAKPLMRALGGGTKEAVDELAEQAIYRGAAAPGQKAFDILSDPAARAAMSESVRGTVAGGKPVPWWQTMAQKQSDSMVNAAEEGLLDRLPSAPGKGGMPITGPLMASTFTEAEDNRVRRAKRRRDAP